MSGTPISTPHAPAAIGPYSQAIRAGELLFVSGQIALDPDTGKLIADRSIGAETQRVLENLQEILRAAGGNLDDVVKTTIYLTDLGSFADVNAVYADYFGDRRPARATVGVAALPLGAAVEIDCIARLAS